MSTAAVRQKTDRRAAVSVFGAFLPLLPIEPVMAILTPQVLDHYRLREYLCDA